MAAEEAEKPTIRIQIISDVICPWCFVAKRQLFAAMEEMKDKATFVVEYQPFFLDPDLRKGSSISKKDAYDSKFGKSEAVRLVEKLSLAFSKVGVEYTHEGVTSNTLDAHRLIEWAQETDKEKRDRLVELLFRAYFEQGRDVGDNEVLLQAVEDSGLDRARAAAILDSDEYERAIDQKMWIHKTRGIVAVPTFVFQGKFRLAGARDVEFFKGLIEQLLEA
ncbi:thioredoxin-like protein [Hyaloraphidium curvatum]|nr:thioredoxin-like protein [Hyaloraphidium curvatum]